MDILLGADPEVFVTKNGTLQSGHGLIPGTKEQPYVVERGAVQVDGLALEFNIDPAATEDEFVMNITQVMNTLKGMIPEHDLLIDPFVTFDKELMDSQPEEAKELGCEPDFNAWTGRMNNPPNAETLNRSAGGHLHIGWTEGADINDPVHLADCIQVVKALDSSLYLSSLYFDRDEKRRELYGTFGSFRPKSYGVEYRVLSNAWIKSEELTRFVYKQTRQVLDMLLKGIFRIHSNWMISSAVIEPDGCNRSVKALLNNNKLEIPDV